MHETCLIIIHDPGMRPGPGFEPGTFGLEDECSTNELTLSIYIYLLRGGGHTKDFEKSCGCCLLGNQQEV